MKRHLFFIFFLFVSIFGRSILFPAEPLIYIRTADSTSLDPGKTTTMYNGEVVSNIFEGLVEYDIKLKKIVPMLATGWKMLDNGRRWRFFLRKNVYFHDGSRMDASDVIYTFNFRNSRREKNYPKWKIFMPYFLRIKKISSYIVDIFLKKPFAPFLTSLSDPVTFIIRNGSGKKSSFSPVGTGPFIFDKWERGKYIALRKNTEYWKKEVRIEKVIFKTVKTPEIAINLLRSGQAHIMELKSIELRQRFSGQKRYTLKLSPPGGIFFMTFNTLKRPFYDKNFRKIFAHLINKKVMIKSIFQNLAMTAKTPLPPGLISHNKNMKDYEYSMSRSRLLMKQSGIRPGFRCRILYLKNDKTEFRLAEIFRKQAAKIGIILEKEPLPFNRLLVKLQSGDFDMALRGWVAGPDPDIYLFSNFSKVKGNSNHGKYFNPRLIDLLNRARETIDKNKRAGLYKKSLEIIHKEVPWIPLYYSRSAILTMANIKNVYINSNFFIIFRDAFINK